MDFKPLTYNLAFYLCKLNYFDVLCYISFKMHLPEDGHNSWPKHVAGYAVYNTINLYICICAGWSCYSQCIIVFVSLKSEIKIGR
jgi:hypothetical protein